MESPSTQAPDSINKLGELIMLGEAITKFAALHLTQ
jgi:hypothetical protein